MVLFPGYNPAILNAYSTVPLTRNITFAVQSAVWDGTFARFGTPKQAVTIYDRPEFHNRSHYEIRTRLDHEGMLFDFMVVNDATITDNAAWMIVSTEKGRSYTKHATELGDPPITYPGENSTIWQIYMRTSDIPYQWAINDGGWGGLIPRWLFELPQPYDSHRPQLPPFSSGWNWTDPALNEGLGCSVYIQANYSEVEFDTLSGVPVERLKSEVAREFGLLQEWVIALVVPKVNETVWLYAPYDWNSPKWPGKKYPGLEVAHEIGS